MFGGISGIGKFLGLVASLLRGLLRASKKRDAQESFDAIERDPAGEFVSRYGGVRDNGREEPGPDPAPEPGERDQE